MLTTLLGIHTIARRHCEAARRQQARVTAGGPSRAFDDRARAPGPKSLGQTSHHADCMRQRAVPPGTGRCQKGAALAVFIPLPKLAVCRHTQYSMQKCEDLCVFGFEPTRVWCVKKKHLSIRPNYSRYTTRAFMVFLNLCKVLVEAPVARVL